MRRKKIPCALCSQFPCAWYNHAERKLPTVNTQSLAESPPERCPPERRELSQVKIGSAAEKAPKIEYPAYSSASKKKLAPEHLFSANQGLVGFCLSRFPFLSADEKEDARARARLVFGALASDSTRRLAFRSPPMPCAASGAKFCKECVPANGRLACRACHWKRPLGTGNTSCAR